MPATYLILPECRLLLTLLGGRLTDSDIFQQQDALRRDPDFRPDFLQLVDCTTVTDVELTADGVRRAARNTALGPDARRALVTTSPSHYGLARMFQLGAVAGEEHISVFRNLPDACAWLGVSEELVLAARDRCMSAADE